MKTISVNGVVLTEDAIEELIYLQTVGSLDNPTPNCGLEMKIESVDNVTNFLIEQSEQIDGESKVVLEILREQNYIGTPLKTFECLPERRWIMTDMIDEYLGEVMELFMKHFKPTDEIALATHLFSTSEIYREILNLNPAAEKQLNPEDVYKLLKQHGYHYEIERDRFSLHLRWMVRGV